MHHSRMRRLPPLFGLETMEQARRKEHWRLVGLELEKPPHKRRLVRPLEMLLNRNGLVWIRTRANRARNETARLARIGG